MARTRKRKPVLPPNPERMPNLPEVNSLLNYLRWLYRNVNDASTGDDWLFEQFDLMRPDAIKIRAAQARSAGLKECAQDLEKILAAVEKRNRERLAIILPAQIGRWTQYSTTLQAQKAMRQKPAAFRR